MKDLDFNNKKVLIRVDFNVPMDKSFNVTDDTRIRGALPTINHVLQQGGAVILMSHLGRPLKKLKEDGTIDVEKNTLRHIVPLLSKLLCVDVKFSEDCLGEVAKKHVAELKKGEVLLLENTRFYAGEENGDEAMAKELASLADIYINDAFGAAHRAHASTAIVAHYFDKNHKSFGYLMESELKNAEKVLFNPNRPLTAIVGGAKVSDKILLLDKLLDSVNQLIIGGGMAYTFMKALGGHTGNSLVEEDKVELAKSLILKAKLKAVTLLLPSDSVIADAFSNDANTNIAQSNEIPDNWMGLDIGPNAIKSYEIAIQSAKTILWNGPMGVFEMPKFAKGTEAIAHAVANATKNGAFSLIGGGDSVAAINQLGLADDVSFVSTGGGAMLELLEGKELPGVTAMGK
ncbi:MAG: phosphoglycerate kinase [Saprospiraceae bacterium]|nr:phosphoglycerate kinase [Saprospiraceae bacterium]